MIIRREQVLFSSEYLVSHGINPDSGIFFDIETTGFKASSSHLYLIGAAFQSGSVWEIIQWLSEKPQEEASLLRSFSDFLSPYDTIIHFNGNRFDIPYLSEKYEQYALPSPLNSMRSEDIYQDIRPYKHFLGCDHMNQKSLEQFLGIDRKDCYDGGKLIPVYRSFCRTYDPSLQHLLLLHNLEDVSGMLFLSSLYSYIDLFRLRTFSIQDIIKMPKGMGKNTGSESIRIVFRTSAVFPVSVEAKSDLMTVSLAGSTVMLEITCITGKLLYFFDNYQDYYYLPSEDEAIHKSIATYVDREHRKNATRENCYTKVEGFFLPLRIKEEHLKKTEPHYTASPLLKSSFETTCSRYWNDPVPWFQATDSFFQNKAVFNEYIRLLLEQILN